MESSFKGDVSILNPPEDLRIPGEDLAPFGLSAGDGDLA